MPTKKSEGMLRKPSKKISITLVSCVSSPSGHGSVHVMTVVEISEGNRKSLV